MNNQFTDSPYMTAQEKTKVLKAWTRFLKGGLQKKDFTAALYEHLIQHCSFIAHFNLQGFYSTYFENGQDTVRFLNQFTTGISAEYGMTYWLNGDYADINRAMQKVAGQYAGGLIVTATAAQRNTDVAEAKKLLAKHGLKVAEVA